MLEALSINLIGISSINLYDESGDNDDVDESGENDDVDESGDNVDVDESGDNDDVDESGDNIAFIISCIFPHYG
jgi:hypothetical protein